MSGFGESGAIEVANYITWEFAGAAYATVSGVIGFAGAVAIWIAAICQSGVVVGGSFGLIPAFVGGLLTVLMWPLVLLVGIIWREPFTGNFEMLEWAETQFEPRSR